MYRQHENCPEIYETCSPRCPYFETTEHYGNLEMAKMAIGTWTPKDAVNILYKKITQN